MAEMHSQARLMNLFRIFYDIQSITSRGLNVKHFYNGVVQVQDHFRYGFVEIDM